MKSGFTISGLAHLLLLILAVVRLPWTHDPAEDMVITEVTVISEAQFDAVTSTVPDIPFTDITSLSDQQVENNDVSRPEDALEVTRTEIDVTEDPTERDQDANLDALLVPLTNPDVVMVESPLFAPSTPEDSAPSFGAGVDGDAQVANLAPSQPRSAALVSQESAAALPNIDTNSDRNVDLSQPDETADPIEPEDTPQTVEDSVTEIVPEATPFPELTAAPMRRPANIAATQAAIEAAEAEAQEEQETETVDAATEPAENTDTVDDLLSQLTDDVEEITDSAPTTQLSAGQAASISSVISGALARTWNKELVIGRPNYEDLIVVVNVQLSPLGEVLNVSPVSPASPTGDFDVAYQAARRAILQVRQFEINPTDIPQGLNINLTFDPSQDNFGVNQ